MGTQLDAKAVMSPRSPMQQQFLLQLLMARLLTDSSQSVAGWPSPFFSSTCFLVAILFSKSVLSSSFFLHEKFLHHLSEEFENYSISDKSAMKPGLGKPVVKAVTAHFNQLFPMQDCCVKYPGAFILLRISLVLAVRGDIYRSDESFQSPGNISQWRPWNKSLWTFWHTALAFSFRTSLFSVFWNLWLKFWSSFIRRTSSYAFRRPLVT